MFEGQPKGLWALALANTGERFGYYTMLAVFVLFLQANFHYDASLAGKIFSAFLMFVYFLPLVGGILADKLGYSKMVVTGVFVMFLGYILLSLPLGTNTVAVATMGIALFFISFGTGLFKGNLQVMVGDLYNDPQYADKRDSGFSLFYMAINIGALFAPTAAIKVMQYAQSIGYSEADSYHFAFGVACLSLIVSIAIYQLGKPTFRQVLTDGKKKANKTEAISDTQNTNDAKDTRERIVCLCLVFAVVIFFWMAFHQNGLTLTFFARDYTATSATGITGMAFNVMNLIWCIVIVYALVALFQKGTKAGKVCSTIAILLAGGALAYDYMQNGSTPVEIEAPIFQQFNPCFVVALTPISIALFGALAKKGKEPKAPVKIGLGMLVAAVAYVVMTMSSIGLPAPEVAADGTPMHMADASPNILISTYLILTFAELLLSPIGISFVTKVAPEKYKGMMMGGWFVSTAIGNFLVSIPAILWGNELYVVWGILACICLVAALFIFSIIKKLNKVA